MAINKKNLAQIVESWTPAVKQITNNAVNESTPDKLAWICEYAHNHTMALNEEAVGGLYFPAQTLNNTNGIGNAVPASFAGQTAADQANPAAIGSGDKWPALLPMALQVAARTVGFDLVNTIPTQGPTYVLPFMDYIYAGSKDVYGATPGYNGATANPQIGVNGKNPAYESYDALHAFRCNLDASTATIKKDFINTIQNLTEYTLTANSVTLKVQFIGLSRLSAQPMFRVLPGQETVSIGKLFGANAELSINEPSVGTVKLSRPRAISALEDQIQGFTGSGKYDSDRWSGTFQNPKHLYEPMDRGTGEQQYPRQMSLKVFTKYGQVGTQSVAVAVTQEQVQDLQKQWGIDVLKLVENSAINELSQSINKHILSRLFALGWKNHVQAYEAEGVNLNIDLTGATTTTYEAATYDERGEYLAQMPVPAYTTYGTGAFENQDTMYKRVAATIMAAGNLVMQRGRRGAANFVVTNWRVASMLQSNSQYAFSPIANTFTQNNGALYPLGTIAGMTVYVDPMMHTQDTRVLVGRKGGKEEPGLTLCPYIMAESIKLIAPETAAPKVLIKSRYALVDVGFYPELQYVTLFINPGAGIVA